MSENVTSVYCLWADRKIVWCDKSEYVNGISAYTPERVLTSGIEKKFVSATEKSVSSQLQSFVCDFLKQDSWGNGADNFIYCGYFRIDVDTNDERASHNMGFDIIAHK